jgi:hypothetical protein
VEKGGATLAESLCAKPVPLAGYYFKVLKRFNDEGKFVELNDGTNRHEYLYAVCAYPAEYGKTGRRTFLVDPWRTPYWKELKGKPVEDRPQFPTREGWKTGILKP